MLLLIVDELNSFPKKEMYAACLEADGVLHANSLLEAEHLLEKKNQVDLLLINKILIEDIEYEIDELKKLSKVFSGAIILKVDDEKLGITLLKSGVITEYYLSDSNENVEFCNLQDAFRLASLKRNITKTFDECRVNFEKIDSLKIEV